MRNLAFSPGNTKNKGTTTLSPWNSSLVEVIELEVPLCLPDGVKDLEGFFSFLFSIIA